MLILCFHLDIKQYAINGDFAAFERLKAMLETPNPIQQESTVRHGQNQFSMSPAAPSPNSIGGNINGYLQNPYREGLRKC
jgi:hypothetical protein